MKRKQGRKEDLQFGCLNGREQGHRSEKNTGVGKRLRKQMLVLEISSKGLPVSALKFEEEHSIGVGRPKSALVSI